MNGLKSNNENNMNSSTYDMQLPSVGQVPVWSTGEIHRSGPQTSLNGCARAHKRCFLQSRSPVYAEFLVLVIYTTAEMSILAPHPGMPINVTSALNGTEYFGELATRDLMVTFTFVGALG